MKWNFTFLILVLCLHWGYSQVTWITQIPYNNGDWITQSSNLIKTQDGNYLFLYERDASPSHNEFTHVLSKYDTQGILLWKKLYDRPEDILGLPGGLNPKSGIEMPNGNIAVVGRIRPDYIAYLYLTDSDGDSLFYQTYPEYKLFSNIAWIDNNTIVVRASASNMGYVLTIDITTGEIESTTQIDFPFNNFFPNNSNHFYAHQIYADSIRIKKYTHTGELLLEKEIKSPEGFGTGNGFFPGVAQNERLNGESGLVIYNNALLELDEGLNPVFSIPFNEDNLNVSIALMGQHESDFILPTSDGGYLMSGSANTTGGNYDESTVFFIKINAEGQEEWSNWYSNWDLPANYIPFILEEPDGYVFIMNSLFDGRTFLVKMTTAGQLVNATELSLIEQPKVFPNPFTESFIVEIDEYVQNGNLSIYTLQGQLIYQKENIQNTQHEVMLNQNPSGVYILKITNKKRETLAVSKIIKR